MTIRAMSQLIAAYPRGQPSAGDAWIERRLVESPRCPVARYLRACRGFDCGRPAEAVRDMMIAHHAEPRLESAGLLVFAGLNWVSRRRQPLLTVLLATWEEFRRPEFDRRRAERLLLDAFNEPADGLQHVSELARKLWRIPILTLRRQLRTAIQSRDATQYAVLLAPA